MVLGVNLQEKKNDYILKHNEPRQFVVEATIMALYWLELKYPSALRSKSSAGWCSGNTIALPMPDRHINSLTTILVKLRVTTITADERLISGQGLQG